MSRDARARLAAAQAEIVRALVAGGPTPGSFDRAHIETARRVIADKRARVARRRERSEPAAPARPPRRWWQRLRTRRSRPPA